eukprot:22069_3
MRHLSRSQPPRGVVSRIVPCHIHHLPSTGERPQQPLDPAREASRLRAGTCRCAAQLQARGSSNKIRKTFIGIPGTVAEELA